MLSDTINKKNNFELYYNEENFFYKKKIPLISIITVVLNAEKVLEKTLLSIINQDYKNTEIIIVYTPSSDRTWSIIQKYKKKIQKIIINYQIGVYHAFNSGVINARGEWLNFMNAGDFFYSTKTISNVFKTKENLKKTDIVYGDSVIYYPLFQRKINSFNIQNIKKHMCFSHQSCFVKTYLQKKNLFDTRYIYAADYNFFVKLFSKNKKFKRIELILSICKAGGIADKNRSITLFEYLKIKHTNKLVKYIYLDFIYILRFYLVNLLKLICKKRFFDRLQKLYYSL